MSLIKLLAYSLLGYVVYELYLGVSQGVEAKKAEVDAGAPPRRSRPNPRGGRSVNVEGQSGSKVKRTVGRGVI